MTEANQAVLTDRCDYEDRLRHADGSYRWASARGQVVKWDINGRARRITSLARKNDTAARVVPPS